MSRTTLFVIAVALAVGCAAWRSHARAARDLPEAAAGPAASCFPPVPSPTSLRKIDEYGNIPWGDEKARLDNFAFELHKDPTMHGYLICYGGRKARLGEARRRCLRAARYLVGARGIDTARIVTADGGFREDLTVELWPHPEGSVPPTATPTVDPSEVTIIRGKRVLKRPPRARGAARPRRV